MPSTMTLKRPRSTAILGGLIILCNTSFSECRLSAAKYASRRELEQYYDFKDEETEGVGGEWGDYEGDPLDPKPSELPLNEDDSPLSETDNQKQSTTGSSKGEQISKESSSRGGPSSTNSYSTSSTSNSYSGGESSTGSSTHPTSTSSSASNSYTGGGYNSGATSSSTYKSTSNTDAVSNYRGYSATGSGAKGGSSSYHGTHKFNIHTLVNLVHVKVPLFPVLLLIPLLTYFAMLWTAFQYQNRPEGVFVNCCRLSVHTTVCIAKV